MSETTTTEAAPVAAKAPAAKRKTKAATKPSTNGHASGWTDNKVKIAKKLNQFGTLTIESLMKKTDLSRRAVYHAIFHLRKDGHVKDQVPDEENVRGLGFALTAAGKGKLAKV